MKIIVDAFGGDNAPAEILKGASLGEKEYGVTSVLCGDSEKIKAAAKENEVDITNMEIIDAPDVIEMEDDPREILRDKANSSMAVGLKSLAEGKGDAFVSAGSTGALVMGSTFYVKRIKGIHRAAIATLMPAEKGPFMLIDGGANTVVKPEMLVYFGTMGSIYMNKIVGIENPRVALANIGTEDTKGTPVYVEANKMMKQAQYNFIGNIEARNIPYSGADVVVCDGFTGNIIMKTYEGVGGMIFKSLKTVFKKNIVTKLAALAVKDGLHDFKKTMDYTEFGGAPLMGIKMPVIKAHGSSNAKAIKNAIRQAKQCAEQNITGLIAENVIVPDTKEESEEN